MEETMNGRGPTAAAELWHTAELQDCIVLIFQEK
jgi:hypothetical protein